ncbi:MAG: Yip1 family protein [Pseudomonadota bacterium]
MNLSLNSLLAMAGRTVQNPREGASEVLSLGIPRDALWMIVMLVVVLSVILNELSSIAAVVRGGVPVNGPVISPIPFAIMQFVAIFGIAGATHAIGRAMGGTGGFPEALLLTAWLQFVMLLVSVVQLVAALILPGMVGIILVLSLALFLWLLTNFVAVLHGFRSLGQVFVMILVSTFAIAFVLSLVLAILGIGIPIEAGGV